MGVGGGTTCLLGLLLTVAASYPSRGENAQGAIINLSAASGDGP